MGVAAGRAGDGQLRSRRELPSGSRPLHTCLADVAGGAQGQLCEEERLEVTKGSSFPIKSLSEVCCRV